MTPDQRAAIDAQTIAEAKAAPRLSPAQRAALAAIIQAPGAVDQAPLPPPETAERVAEVVAATRPDRYAVRAELAPQIEAWGPLSQETKDRLAVVLDVEPAAEKGSA